MAINNDRISRSALLAAYDAAHKGPPGGSRKLIEEAPGVSDWISVKDRLPDEDGHYLTYHGQSHLKQTFGLTGVDLIGINTWSKQRGGWWSMECKRLIFGITYWQVLAEPPKEDEDDAER